MYHLLSLSLNLRRSDNLHRLGVEPDRARRVDQAVVLDRLRVRADSLRGGCLHVVCPSVGKDRERRGRKEREGTNKRWRRQSKERPF